jgi:hypothetical protein
MNWDFLNELNNLLLLGNVYRVILGRMVKSSG